MKITKELKEELQNEVDRLNKKLSTGSKRVVYHCRFSGAYMYLDYQGHQRKEKRVRLKYNGKMDNWDFAIFRWSSETYDEDCFFFSGAEELDGTIEGAMKAGYLAYK
jgi:hypothetical protein